MTPRTAARTAAALTALLLVAGCSDEEGAADTIDPPSFTPDPCAIADELAPIPAECVQEAPASATAPPPSAGSAAYKPIVLPASPTRLIAVGNDKDVSKTSETFTVTVKKGQRLGSHVVCEGQSTLKVVTVPDSGAALEVSCGFEGIPAELQVRDPELLAADQTYKVTVSAPAPARWYAELYTLDKPVAPDDGSFNPQ